MIRLTISRPSCSVKPSASVYKNGQDKTISGLMSHNDRCSAYLFQSVSINHHGIVQISGIERNVSLILERIFQIERRQLVIVLHFLLEYIPVLRLGIVLGNHQ